MLQNYLTSYASAEQQKKTKKKKKPIKKSAPVTFDIFAKQLEKTPDLVNYLVDYLRTPYGPGIEVFKLKHLNKTLEKAI